MSFLKVKDGDCVLVVTELPSSAIDPKGVAQSAFRIYRVSAGFNQDTVFIPIDRSIFLSEIPQTREDLERLFFSQQGPERIPFKESK